MAPLLNPRQHRWDDHFAWSADSRRVLGRTPTGRATIARLQLNRPHLMALRQQLRAVGEHPPSGNPIGE